MKTEIIQAIKKLYEIDFDAFEVAMNNQARFGVYQSNVAFVISKRIERGPVEIAKEIVKELILDEHEYHLKAEKGYINFYLPNEFRCNPFIGDVKFSTEKNKQSDYFIYRINFLYRRLKDECIELERIKIFDDDLKYYFIDFFIHHQFDRAIEHFLKFDRKTLYSTLDNYEKNIFFTILAYSVDKINNNA